MTNISESAVIQIAPVNIVNYIHGCTMPITTLTANQRTQEMGQVVKAEIREMEKRDLYVPTNVNFYQCAAELKWVLPNKLARRMFRHLKNMDSGNPVLRTFTFLPMTITRDGNLKLQWRNSKYSSGRDL